MEQQKRDYLQYSKDTQSNIIPKEDFEGLFKETFDVIATNLAKSLGPLGSSATILDGNNLTEATKDGFTILSKYDFRNKYKEMIYNLILSPCTKMNNTVGDGTTTAIVLANELFNQYMIRKYNLDMLYRLPRSFTETWDHAIEDITEYIKSHSTPVDTNGQMVYNIAYVTSNGNKDISKAIESAYREVGTPSIKMKDSPTNKSYMASVAGFDFPANMTRPGYAKNDDMSSEEKDPAVMIFDHKVDIDIFTKIIRPISDVMRARKTKFLVVAPFYDENLLNTTFDQYMQLEMHQSGDVNLITLKYEIGKLGKEQLHDLSVVLGCSVVTEADIKSLMDECTNPDVFIENELSYENLHSIGHADSVMLTCNNGTIFKISNMDDNYRYKEALRVAKNELNEIMASTDSERKAYSTAVYQAKQRINQLEMKNYIFYVGADSTLQKQIAWAAIDDVIKCVQSATKSGIVPGCQLTIIEACNHYIDEIFKESGVDGSQFSGIDQLRDDLRLRYEILIMISSAVIEVYQRVLNGPNGDGVLKTMEGWDKIEKDQVDEFRLKLVDRIGEIIDESINRKMVYDLETMTFSEDIITSAETDTMVLSTASELVKTLISGNQCIYVTGAQTEDIDSYLQ